MTTQAEAIFQALARARVALDGLIDEVQRLQAEAVTFGLAYWTGPVLGWVLGLDERAEAVSGLLEQAERFARDVFPRVEAKALAGDLAAAVRLAEATDNIRAVVAGTSPSGELRADLAELVQGIVDDVDTTASLAAFVGGGAVLGGFVGSLAGPRGMLLGGALGGLSGALARSLLSR